MGDGGRVASSQNDALIKGNVARQGRKLKASAAAPSNTPSGDVVGLVPGGGEVRKASRGEKKKKRKQKRRESQLVGGSLRQGCRDLRFRKVSRLLLSQRATSLLGQKPNRR